AALQAIYEEALLEPRFNSQNLIWVGLQRPGPGGEEEKDVLSELEIHGTAPYLQVELGAEPQRNRREAMRQVGQPDARLTLGEVRSLYHVSPKRYLGANEVFVVNKDGQPVAVDGHKIVQAAWRRLIQLTYDWRKRNPALVSGGSFSRVIVTYPTVAPPAVRA